MKNVALAAAATLIVLSSLPGQAEPAPLPNSGTYFITNMSSDEALQPVAGSTGQNVYVYEFKKSGMQKWAIDRKLDPKTKKPTNRYTIKLAGEAADLNFEPHPATDSSAILGMDKSTFVLESGEAGILIKSVAKNGDALYIYPNPPMDTETRFGPNDDSTKFRWKFTVAE